MLERLAVREELTDEEIAYAMEGLLGGFSQAQSGAFLAALKTKGETAGEMAVFALEMRKRMVHVDVQVEGCVDTCGTGGDGSRTFNISTAAAFVAAGAGVPVAKHGNRSVTSRCGSADVMDALGVSIETTPGQVARCIREAGIGFMFAPLFHPAMKAIAPVRRELGVGTVFNLIGPLANPAGVRRQVVGVCDKERLAMMAAALLLLGTERALVVHGGGMDELSLAGENEVLECVNGEIRPVTIDARELGLEPAPVSAFRVDNAKQSAERIREVLCGKEGPCRDVVLLNAAAAIYVGGKAGSLENAISLAEKAIDSGTAMEALERLRVESNR